MKYFYITEANDTAFFFFFLAAYWLARELVEKMKYWKLPKGRKKHFPARYKMREKYNDIFI